MTQQDKLFALYTALLQADASITTEGIQDLGKSDFKHAYNKANEALAFFEEAWENCPTL